MAVKITEDTDNNELIDLGHYLGIIKRYSLRILLLAIAFTILVTILVMKMTPLYTSSTTLLIEAEKANVVSIEEVYGIDTKSKDYMATQFEVLKSRQIAEKTVESLSLYENADFMPEENDSSLLADVTEIFPFLPQKEKVELTKEQQIAKQKRKATHLLMNATDISLVKGTQLVRISVTTEKPSLSALIANTIAEVYIENYLQAKLDMTAKATSFLTDSIDGLKTKLDVAERNLVRFYETNQVVNIDGVVGLASDELERLNIQLSEAEVELKLNSVIFNQIKDSKAIEDVARIPEVLNHPAVRDVRRDEGKALTRVSELSKVYGPKHPKMIAANAELSSIRDTLNTQITDLISSITTQYESSKQKVAQLQREVETSKAAFRSLAELDNKRKALEREVDINQQLYDSFFTRLKETDELGGLESANARVLDTALPSYTPSKPNKKLFIAAAFVLSLSFGIALAIVMETLNSGIRSVDDVEKKLGQRMLGLIPWLAHKKKTDLPIRTFFDGKKHQFAEAVRTLRTSLSLLNIEKENQAILVTSSVPKEGKTTVSINLAFALGQLDKTILIDADLRRPSIGKQFNIPSYQPGVANLVLKSHSFEECLVRDEESNIDILSAGTIPSNPQELLADKGFEELITKLKSEYKYVVVDTAPTQAVSDSMIVANSCDSVIYVVRADSTSDKVINNGLSRFLQVGHRLDGVVLNQVNLRKSDVAQRYAGFYDQYGYTSQKSS
ncbi:GumC family protein [Alteromonas mediterranea]|jgi:polysaccharide biosynthesis transport protein|uniref:non-specific protein-tyrosine kinase n=1 Tax=Alteromonas mediterranea TaxID=314275 RepID=A0AAC8XIW7_9ALTE|nr:polysaccharide biosynthesis tyrosine autokinase [Alteromonas mediterranea]AFV85152.1 putative Exopolysaccharide biosynthesis protein [Alteromonas mediterranea DE1]AGP97163.1 exopolysaccharide biosynthesis protein [Alteromonas mediterranea UM7]AGQ01507.1 exopolysaccharide biosynthesis protein [Alteromonas mediterranea UM4b]AMJ78255.1 chain-length determining protein [Alteromonas mediterranea]AMJ82404.1 chain-length determining protein [Alteromonas mediterranea]